MIKLGVKNSSHLFFLDKGDEMNLNVKVSADAGTGRYCLWGGSYQETVYCIVLNSSPMKVLSSKSFKLFKATPFQKKPKLLRVIVNSWAWQVSLIICTLVIFFFCYWIIEKKKHFQNQRNTYVLHCSRE